LVGAVLGVMVGGSCRGSSDDEMSRSAQIYLAVIEAVLAHEPAAPRDELPVVYVVPVGESHIPAAVQADLADVLHEEADLRFADQRSEAVLVDEERMPVRDSGVLIAIGEVPESGEPVDVDVEVYRSVDDSSTSAFTFARRSSQWTVTSSSVLASEPD
jgi:hypothetical protein